MKFTMKNLKNFMYISKTTKNKPLFLEGLRLSIVDIVKDQNSLNKVKKDIGKDIDEDFKEYVKNACFMEQKEVPPYLLINQKQIFLKDECELIYETMFKEKMMIYVSNALNHTFEQLCDIFPEIKVLPEKLQNDFKDLSENREAYKGNRHFDRDETIEILNNRYPEINRNYVVLMKDSKALVLFE